ncbi:exodeoxyribonuclease I [Candidatus Saccharibacteria bacterium]|nr:exodeoxyribonuclease I [Candidatus Saccharibacteria bacterium]
MATPTFFFYDLETSGLSGSDDRIMQFAGQRTDTNLQPVGDPYNILVKLNDDTLPSPGAILTTHITPQKTVQDGIPERELAQILTTEVFTPDTTILGFNSVRFDDKFIQHLFWRNFYDPYEWQWKDGRSRWDMLDVVRMTRALRPEGINWPTTADGKPTNRLELITKANGISHESAHDALSDVNALVDVTRLIRDKQPKLWQWLFKLRDKREVRALINLENPQPFVYSSGRFGSTHNFTTVCVPVFPGKNGNLVVFDLRYNFDELIEEAKKTTPDFLANPDVKLHDLFFPKFKELAYNRCPAVAPLSVLETGNGWDKIELSKAKLSQNLTALHSHADLLKRLQNEHLADKYDKAPYDAETALYDGFLDDRDRVRTNAIRDMDAEKLADFHPNFADERLPELLLHYKAKNFPTSLTEPETQKWEEYRKKRIARQSTQFIAEMQKFQKEGADDFILQELYLWYQSLQDPDY